MPGKRGIGNTKVNEAIALSKEKNAISHVGDGPSCSSPASLSAKKGPTQPFPRKEVANANKALPWKEKNTLPHGGGARTLTQFEDKVKSGQVQGWAEGALAAPVAAAKGADGGKSWRQADRHRGGRQWQQRQGQVGGGGRGNVSGKPVHQGTDPQNFQHYAPVPAKLQSSDEALPFTVQPPCLPYRLGCHVGQALSPSPLQMFSGCMPGLAALQPFSLDANDQEIDSYSDSGFSVASSEAAATDSSDCDIIVSIHADDVPGSGGKFREAQVNFEETSASITMALESGKVSTWWTHDFPGAVDVSQCRFGLTETRHELKITFKKAERCADWDVGVSLHCRPPPEKPTSNAGGCNQDDADSKNAGDNHTDDRNYDNAGCKDADDRGYDTDDSPPRNRWDSYF